jgi:hypothetical protein
MFGFTVPANQRIDKMNAALKAASIADALDNIPSTDTDTLDDMNTHANRHRAFVFSRLSAIAGGDKYKRDSIAEKLGIELVSLPNSKDALEVAISKQAWFMARIFAELSASKLTAEMQIIHNVAGESAYDVMWHLRLIAAYEQERRVFNSMINHRARAA